MTDQKDDWLGSPQGTTFRNFLARLPGFITEQRDSLPHGQPHNLYLTPLGIWIDALRRYLDQIEKALNGVDLKNDGGRFSGMKSGIVDQANMKPDAKRNQMDHETELIHDEFDLLSPRGKIIVSEYVQRFISPQPPTNGELALAHLYRVAPLLFFRWKQEPPVEHRAALLDEIKNFNELIQRYTKVESFFNRPLSYSQFIYALDILPPEALHAVVQYAYQCLQEDPFVGDADPAAALM